MLSVILDEDQQAACRAACKAAYPKETYGLMGGHEGVGEFRIVRFYPVEYTNSKDGMETYPDKDAYERAKRQIKADGLTLIGTYHSHPDADWAPSSTDHLGAVHDGEKLMCICHVWKDKHDKVYSRFGFWQPQSPCKIVIRRSIPE